MNKDFLLLCIVTAMSVAANLPETLLSLNGLDRKILVFGLLFVICIALIRYSKFVLVLAIAILALGANLPSELAATLNIEPRIMTLTLAIVVLFSLANRILRLPTGLDNTSRSKFDEGSKALVRAVIQGRIPIVERLVKAGANVNARSSQGYTMLMIAAGRGHDEIVSLLLGRGADLTMVDPKGRNALQHAREGGHTSCSELLLNASRSTFNHTDNIVRAA